METHFGIVGFLSGGWLRRRRRFGLHFLLGHDRWLSNWSWLWNRNRLRFGFNLWWRWNLLNLWFRYPFILLLCRFLIFLLVNGTIINWLCLNIHDILINGLLRCILNGAIFILNLHKSPWPRWYKLIHLLKHRINLHLRSFNNLVSYSFLHQVHLTLPDYFHQLIL